MKPNSQSGFTLVQVAVIVVVVGLTAGAFFSALSVRDARTRDERTKDTQRVVASALSDYAQRHYTLPCPGDPAAATANAIGLARATCNTAALRVGVVPFRTLGLSPNEALDGYGNPMTYAVQADISGVNEGYVTGGNVFGPCRTQYPNGWHDGSTPDNANMPKANLCCREVPNANRLVVQGQGGAAPVDLVLPQSIPVGMVLEHVNRPAHETDANVADANLDYIAYVLVSHGKDERGVYRLGSGARTSFAGAGAGEILNVRDDALFADFPQNSEEGNAHFDDIVLWRTQYRLISDLRNDSCTYP